MRYQHKMSVHAIATAGPRRSARTAALSLSLHNRWAEPANDVGADTTTCSLANCFDTGHLLVRGGGRSPWLPTRLPPGRGKRVHLRFETVDTQPTTPPEPTDAQRIAGAGYPITLANGQRANVRFGLRALKLLEERYGSLVGIAECLREMAVDPDHAKMIAPTWDLLEAGLLHLRLEPEDLDALLDPNRLAEYTEAVARAFREAMPAGKAEAAAVATAVAAPPTPTTEASTGPASTGSGPSPLGAPTPPGGA